MTGRTIGRAFFPLWLGQSTKEEKKILACEVNLEHWSYSDKANSGNDDGRAKCIFHIGRHNFAVLVVTSGRNGAIFMGKASTTGEALFWQTLDEIKQGEPE